MQVLFIVLSLERSIWLFVMALFDIFCVYVSHKVQVAHFRLHYFGLLMSRVTRWVGMEIRTLANFESEHIKKGH